MMRLAARQQRAMALEFGQVKDRPGGDCVEGGGIARQPRARIGACDACLNARRRAG
jgi:hypothetical protein